MEANGSPLYWGSHGFEIDSEVDEVLASPGFRTTDDRPEEVRTEAIRDLSGDGEGECAPDAALVGRFMVEPADDVCTVRVVVRVRLIPEPTWSAWWSLGIEQDVEDGSIHDPAAVAAFLQRALGIPVHPSTPCRESTIPERGRAAPTRETVERKKGQWKDTITSIWSRKHYVDLQNCEARIPVGAAEDCGHPAGPPGSFYLGRREWHVEVAVDWVDADLHHDVFIYDGHAHRATSHCWHTEQTARTTAHEFGHLLGLLDEYCPEEEDDACPGRIITGSDSIMNDHDAGRAMYWHFRFIDEWAARRLCCSPHNIQVVGSNNAMENYEDRRTARNECD
jgi:hypothetical protein